MRSPPKFTRLMLVLSLAAAAACSDMNEPTQPGAGPGPSATLPDLRAGQFDSDALARAIPGNGGFFIDAMGVPTLRLKDLSASADAQRIMQPWLRSMDLGTQLRVIKADYTAKQLDAWAERASPQILRLPRVVFVDNNEELGKIVVAVESRGAEASVRAAMQRLGIPREGVSVMISSPIREAITLRDKVRPVIGGLQINFTNFLCTLGFNVLNTGDRRPSFITNSHCTRTRGTIAPATLYNQPLSGAGNFIGTEVEDPPFFVGGLCPAGRKCRRSDAARAVYAAGVTNTRGRIERTSGPGSLTIVGQWTITGEEIPVAGRQLHKVGRTTGWSFGPVTFTNITVNVNGTNITMLNQDIVRANVNSGDSGSPVFRRLTSTGTTVRLNGILWGGGVINGATQFVLSNIQRIEAELGAMTTF